MSHQWVPVDLTARWTERRPEETVNVGEDIKVVALLMPLTIGSSRWEPILALIMRRKYRGSDRHPSTVTITETVGIGKGGITLELR
jgi:hypothetical protein